MIYLQKNRSENILQTVFYSLAECTELHRAEFKIQSKEELEELFQYLVICFNPSLKASLILCTEKDTAVYQSDSLKVQKVNKKTEEVRKDRTLLKSASTNVLFVLVF